jgi:hypothetical protein
MNVDGNITIAATGTGVITIDSPITAATGILIGNTLPAGSATGYVQIGTPTSPGVLVRANLDVVVVSTAGGTASCTGNNILLSGGATCTSGSVTSVSYSGKTVTATCSTTIGTTYAVCLQSP